MKINGRGMMQRVMMSSRRAKVGQNLPIPVNVNLYASVDSVFAAVSPVTSEALLFGDVDVLAVSIVSSSIPSSVLDSDFLLSSDFGFRGLVAVARWEDAERDPGKNVSGSARS